MANIKEFMEKNKNWIDLFTAALFFLLIFRDVLEGYLAIPYVKYLDEAIAALAFPLFALEVAENHGIPRRKYRFGMLVSGICLIGWISSLVYRYQNFSICITDFFLLLKFWLVLYVGRQLAGKCSSDALRKISKGSVWLLIVFLILTLLDYRLHIFDAETVGNGLRVIQIFFSHSSFFCAAVLTLTAAYLAGLPGDRKPNIFLLLISSFLMCSTLRAKAFAAAFSVLWIYCMLYLLKKQISFRAILLYVPAVILIGWYKISAYFLNGKDTARYQLMEKSVLIAGEHFPLGAGFGTFGSYASTVNYSPLYEKYGLTEIYGLTPADPCFACDSFWPMILAQYGVFGLILYIVLLLFLFMKIVKVRFLSLSAYTGCLYIFVYLLIASTAETAFVHPVAMPMALVLGLCIGKYSVSERVSV